MKNSHAETKKSKKSAKSTAKQFATIVPFPAAPPSLGNEARAAIESCIDAVRTASRSLVDGKGNAASVLAALEAMSEAQVSAFAMLSGTHSSGAFYVNPLAALGSLLSLAPTISDTRVIAQYALRSDQKPADVIDLAAVRRGISLAKRTRSA